MAKKINSLLKGVAITGASVGGAAFLGDIQMVYADEAISETTGTLTIDVEVPAQEVQGEQQAAQEMQVEQPAAPAQEIQAEQPAAPAQDILTEQPTELEQTNALDDSFADVAPVADTTTSEMTDEQLSESAEASLSQEEYELASTSESQSEAYEFESTSLSDALEQDQTNYEATSQAFEESPYSKEGVAEKENDVIAAMNNADAALKAVQDSNAKEPRLNGANYYNDDTARKLAFEMIKFKLLLTGEVDADHVDKIKYAFFTNGYEENHLVVKYIDGDGQYQEKYFDYVTCDKDGNSIFTASNHPEDIARNVIGINVVEKTPIFSNQTKTQTAYAGTDAEQKVQFYQRDDFAVNENGSKKGVDWYTRAQLLEDIKNRSDFLSTIASLKESIEDVKTKTSELAENASTYAIQSQSAAELRNQSLADSAEASTSARIAKSESLSSSMATSESESLEASATASESLALAEASARAAAAANSAADTAAVAETSEATGTSVAASVATTAAATTATTVNTTIDETANMAQATNETANGGQAATVNANANPVVYAAVGEEDVPLNVIFDDEEVTEAGNITTNRVDSESVVGNQQIGDESVAKGIKIQGAESGRKGVFFGLAAAIAAKVAYDKTKSDMEDEKNN